MAREGAAARRTALVSMRAQMHLPIPPVWMDSPRTSILEQLDTLVMRYIPQLEGVLLTHADARFLGTLGGILGDSAFAEAPVAFTALVWRPQIGMRLEGAITLSSPSHVSLLLHGTFNAAISAQHLPAAKYEFVHYDDDDAHAARTDPRDRSVGFWRHKKTGERLGGTEQRLAFTVISMTVANHMLSLHGSLLKDPFSVAPPRPGSLSFDQALAEHEPLDEEQEEEEEAKPAAGAPAPQPSARKLRFDSDSESDTDTPQAPREPVEVDDDGHDSASSDEYADARTSDASASDDASSDADDAPTTAVPRKPVRHDEAEAVAAQRKAEKRRKAHAHAAEDAAEAEVDALHAAAARSKKEKKEKHKGEKKDKKEKEKKKKEKKEKEKKGKKEKDRGTHEPNGDVRPKEKRKSEGEDAASSKRRKAST